MATIDERLAFLLQSTESLHASMAELVDIQRKTEASIQALAKDQLRMKRHFSLFETTVLGFAVDYSERLQKIEDKYFEDKDGKNGDTAAG